MHPNLDNLKDLEKIMYALTLADRPNTKLLWLSKGFAKIIKKPGFLFNYWKNRLQKGSPNDICLYSKTLAKYHAAIKYIPNNNLDKSKKESEEKIKEFEVSSYSERRNKENKDWSNFKTQIADEVLKNNRLQICKSCSFYDEKIFSKTAICKKCGCGLKTKIRFLLEKCPINLW